MLDLRGRTLGRYRLVTELGAGGMGTVYYAEHVSIGRRAAVKVLDPALASDHDLVQRFFTEARAVNALRHPNIVDVEDVASEGDLHYLVMELLEGETLGARLEREKKLTAEDLVPIVRPIAAALAAAHELGMVHRDLKPENVFLARKPDGKEQVKLLDFGIVKLAGGAQRVARTQAGLLLGTPAYMSPEQCAGMPDVDARSDVYSLGVLLYEALAGRPPFVRKNVLGLISAHQCEVPVPLCRIEPSVPARVSEAVMQALEKAPDARPQGALALAEALERGVLAAAGRAADFVPVSVERKRQQTKNVGSKLSEIVGQRIASGTLTIPSMPDACMHCMELLRMKNVRMRELAERVRRDPMLSTRMLAVANSSALGGRERVLDVENALVRLGTESSRAIVIEMAVRQVFVSKDAALRELMRTIWERSIAISVTSGLVASAIQTEITRGAAQSAGLLAEIGHPLLAALLLDVERSSPELRGQPGAWISEEVFAGVVREHGRDVGARVAKDWALPEEIVSSITERDTWDTDAGPNGMKNVVRYAADLASSAGYPLPGIGVADGELVAGRNILGLSLEAEQRIASAVPQLVLEQVGKKPAASTTVRRSA